MFKNSTAFLVVLLMAFSAQAQTDSITFVKAKWETHKIAPGVKWKHYWFNKNLFDTNQNINILEIDRHKKVKLALGYQKQELKLVSDFATLANAVAAINGSFFDVKNGGAVDLIRVNGEIISPNKFNKAGVRAVHQKSALLFNNGTVSIAKWDGTNDWESHLNGDIMDTGPLLVYDNNIQVLDTTSLIKMRHPRTAVAITKKHILLITIDGRNTNAGGVNLYELAKLLKWLKTTDGINLDGGGSTTMWINKQTDNGIVNYPCDNKKWDRQGARKVANVLLVE
ncbi:uncharacterized protein DUF2233 [Mucilaginibacter gracilis]|uniref:Uncharacterized protein DUF2233 n=1 Tax=Mucilaginibacter gracilis TaxID=423350 RepID=A0A495IVT1_9SPHI|nr:phosphodiester glycosidase family protein [Mucilaginibacter gracilis]RKR80855.1 uncharacterized protein DUF2233 [Mucilaginibacter gracilis]